MTDKPSISLFLLGGTISMAPSSAVGGGVVPTVSADDLCRAVPGIEKIANVKSQTSKMIASANLTLQDALNLKEIIEELADKDNSKEHGLSNGIVIVQGTDTMEEMAFILDLVLDVNVPVVVTGAMRSANMVSADGPANILASVIAASEKSLAKAGVMVAMNDEIHAARYVQKCHTRDVGAFKSLNGGLIGQVCEGAVRIGSIPDKKRTLNIDKETSIPKVGLLKATLGDDGDLLKSVLERGYDGLVIEAFGAGHLPESWLASLETLLNEIPIMLCSRTLEGPVFENTYGYKGAEIDLIARGLIPSGILDGPKARLYMQASIMAGKKINKPDY